MEGWGEPLAEEELCTAIDTMIQGEAFREWISAEVSAGSVPLSDLRFVSRRTCNLLTRHKLLPLRRLLLVQREQLACLAGVGARSAREILRLQKRLMERIVSGAWESSFDIPSASGASGTSSPAFRMTGKAGRPLGSARAGRETRSRRKPVSPARAASRTGGWSEAPVVAPDDPWPRDSLLNHSLNTVLRPSPQSWYGAGDDLSVTATLASVLKQDATAAGDLENVFRKLGLSGEDPWVMVLDLSLAYLVQAGLNEQSWNHLQAHLNRQARDRGIVLKLNPRALAVQPILGPTDYPALSRALVHSFLSGYGVLGTSPVSRAASSTLTERHLVSDYGLTMATLSRLAGLWLRRRLWAPELERLDHLLPLGGGLKGMLRHELEKKGVKPRAMDVLWGRLGLDGSVRTLEELGLAHGLSRERIRQIEKKARGRLKMVVPGWGILRHLVPLVLKGFRGSMMLPELERELDVLLGEGFCGGENTLRMLLEEWDGQVALSPEGVVHLRHPKRSCQGCQPVEQHLLLRLAASPEGELDRGELERELGDFCLRHCPGRNVSGGLKLSRGFLGTLPGLGNSFHLSDGKVVSRTRWYLGHDRLRRRVEGVLLEAREALHFSEVTRRVKRDGERDDRHISSRMVHASLTQAPFALLWERGTFIHRDYVVIPAGPVAELGERVRIWLTRRKLPALSVHGLFARFHEYLTGLGIPGPTALHTAFRETPCPGIRVQKYPLISLETVPEGFRLSGFVSRLFHAHPGLVPQERVRRLLIDDMMVNRDLFPIFMEQVPRVLSVPRRGFIHERHLGALVDLEGLDALLATLDQELARNRAVHSGEFARTHSPLCRRAGLEDAALLWAALRVVAPPGRYAFSRGRFITWVE